MGACDSHLKQNFHCGTLSCKHKGDGATSSGKKKDSLKPGDYTEKVPHMGNENNTGDEELHKEAQKDSMNLKVAKKRFEDN